MGTRIVSLACATLLLLAADRSAAQEAYSSGQNIGPIFEGWRPNPDGTSSVVFGYLNRNWDEEIDIPVGPGNSIDLAGPDRGQPTHFLPRRNRFLFAVQVPKDFGTKELVWTVTAHGKTERAYATLRPEYIIDDLIMMMNTAGRFGERAKRGETNINKAPALSIEGGLRRTGKVGQPLTLTAVSTDDGVPQPTAAPGLTRGTPGYPATPGRFSALGLRVAWFVYRGAGKVAFSPAQFKVYQDTRENSPWAPGWMPPPVPPDGKYTVQVTIDEPGTYVLRCLAHDGALGADQDVTITVTP